MPTTAPPPLTLLLDEHHHPCPSFLGELVHRLDALVAERNGELDQIVAELSTRLDAADEGLAVQAADAPAIAALTERVAQLEAGMAVAEAFAVGVLEEFRSMVADLRADVAELRGLL